MSITCKTTPEQKEIIFKKYYFLLQNLSGFYLSKITNHSSYKNVYLNHVHYDVGQTRREPDDYGAEEYFIWEDFEKFDKRLCNLLIEKKRIKV